MDIVLPATLHNPAARELEGTPRRGLIMGTRGFFIGFRRSRYTGRPRTAFSNPCSSHGGASGIVGGLGALGGFVIPPMLGLFAGALGPAGYSGGFFIYVVLAFAAMLVSISFVAASNRITRAASRPG